MDIGFSNWLWSCMYCEHNTARKSVPLLALMSFPLYGSCELPINSSSKHLDWL
ncbi:hypothetical protein Godav_024717 [Gossypium davidsonii]|uniref:Uncharacterized protein n=1 Tax=Gossypium davidsonii TaxID=34287 RepID=A0A7J8T5E4_GOSDV|nr:hypothetical protein [Gossypium davidsonii]